MGKRPNVLVFLTDQQRWDTAGVQGNPMGLTPNFDRMATHGTHLANTFTMQPVCGPARSCMQTGLYATTTGCFRNGIPLPEHAETLAQYFKSGGYRTAYIGKWHLASEEPVPAHKRGGYEYWRAAEALEMVSDAYHTVLYDNDNREVLLPGYRVDALADEAIRYVHAHREDDRPFFLFLSFLEPHHQNHRDDYPAPRGYEEKYRGGYVPPDLQALQGTAYRHLPGYYGMVKRLDEAFGRILDALHSMRLEDETIIWFTSDHGSHFKTRNKEYKRSCHESSIHVPAAVQGPGFWGGGRVDDLVSLLDLPSTLLDACGLEVPEQMQGRSLMPLLRRERVEWRHEVYIQISESQVGRAIRTKRWKYGVNAPDKHGFHDSASEEYVEECLYDLYADPYELDNLIGLESHRATADYLKERLLVQMEEAGEGRAAIHNAPARTSGQRRVALEEIYQ